jgi:hypothetical protein
LSPDLTPSVFNAPAVTSRTKLRSSEVDEHARMDMLLNLLPDVCFLDQLIFARDMVRIQWILLCNQSHERSHQERPATAEEASGPSHRRTSWVTLASRFPGVSRVGIPILPLAPPTARRHVETSTVASAREQSMCLPTSHSCTPSPFHTSAEAPATRHVAVCRITSKRQDYYADHSRPGFASHAVS